MNNKQCGGKDSYQEFLDSFGIDKEALYQWGISATIFPPISTVTTAWSNLKERVFTDQKVILFILAEFAQSRRQDDQFAVVGNRHPGAVNRLVAQPGALDFFRIEVDHHFFQRFVQQFQIGFNAEIR